MTYLLLLFLFILLYILTVELYPVRVLRARSSHLVPYTLPDLYLYSFQIHIHTQFSYDSLGKPEDLLRSADEEHIDYLIVTDHENDHIGHFSCKKIIAGVERKINDPKGKILGDLLEVGGLRVIAHPFKAKYEWKLPIPKDYFFELIDLKDALLERKGMLLFLLPYLLVRGFFSIDGALEVLKKALPVEKYARRFMRKNINNPVLGGLDHHVKVYIREVGIKILLPDYRYSFRLMRNFLLSWRRVEDKEDFLEELKEGNIVISFDRKPTLFWEEKGLLKVLPPKECLLHCIKGEEEIHYAGTYFELEAKGKNLFIGYDYKLKLGRVFLGLKPMFIIFWTEDKNGRAPTA
jgi:hypothetical protein